MVFFLSAYTKNTHFRNHCMSLGVKHIYDKPLNPNQLQEMLVILENTKIEETTMNQSKSRNTTKTNQTRTIEVSSYLK